MKWQLALVLLAGVFLAADAPKDDAAKKDVEKLQGSWKLESLEVEGTKIGENERDARFIVKGDKYTFKSAEDTEEGTYKLDAGKKPKTIDITITAGQDKEKTQLGIYEIEGEKLRICAAHPGAMKRPTEFTGKAGSESLLFTFKREKP